MSLDMGEEECAKDRPQLAMVGDGLGRNQRLDSNLHQLCPYLVLKGLERLFPALQLNFVGENAPLASPLGVHQPIIVAATPASDGDHLLTLFLIAKAQSQR